MSKSTKRGRKDVLANFYCPFPVDREQTAAAKKPLCAAGYACPFGGHQQSGPMTRSRSAANVSDMNSNNQEQILQFLPAYLCHEQFHGKCNSTAKCSKLHLNSFKELGDLRALKMRYDSIRKKRPVSSKAPLAAKASKAAKEAAASTPKPKPMECPVCFDMIDPSYYGLQQNCQHCICAKCIISWMELQPVASPPGLKTMSCPICRTTSNLIVIWPAIPKSVEEKARIFEIQQRSILAQMTQKQIHDHNHD